jgi:predicted metal-dependent phosphoesterase TrpH
MIDLHSHTTASDGQHGPVELLALAKVAGVTHLAVTDHDTVASIAAARSAAEAQGIRLVAGIELSAFHNGREVHVLGHFIREDEAELLRMAARLRDDREDRMERMVARMRQLGFPVTMQGVRRIAGDANLGRPHLALLLVELGYCVSTKEAFERFLGDRKPGWVDRFRLPASDAIALVRNAGGVATLAHPGVNKVERHDVEELAKAGLGGLEAFHVDHVPSQRDKYLLLAKTYGLVPTGGSDFHGERVTPGRKLGDATTPRDSFAALCAKAGVSL